jgi:hypothetical protein
MTLQNRIRPDGAAEAVAARGLFTGNRGILHDPATRRLTGRRWTTTAWIACALVHKDVRRVPMARRSWTELFFLDEVTALAAGHRPCFACRPRAARAFLAAASGARSPRAFKLDERLHAERRLSARAPARALTTWELARLPDGAMIAAGERFFAVRKGRALAWTHHGYDRSLAFGELAGLAVSQVTADCVLEAFAAGYRPVWHPSAER